MKESFVIKLLFCHANDSFQTRTYQTSNNFLLSSPLVLLRKKIIVVRLLLSNTPGSPGIVHFRGSFIITSVACLTSTELLRKALLALGGLKKKLIICAWCHLVACHIVTQFYIQLTKSRQLSTCGV